MEKFKFCMTGAAMALAAALSGCGGGSSDVGDGGGHVPPTVSATLPTSATASAPVSITGITVANGAALTVDWGDGTQDTPAAIPTSLTHTYAATAACVKTGTCNIDLAVLGWGPAAELKGAVAVSPPPSLAATLPTTGTVSVPVSISGIAAANGTALSVDWGDGTKETPATSVTSLTHTYAGAGSYAIDLVLSGANSTKAETTGSVTINAIAQPVLAATLPTTGVAGTAVSVTGVTTTDGTALSVNWGDGVTETPALSATTLSHTYAAAGTYTIDMVLTGSAASTPAEKSGSITIGASGPVCDATADLFISEYIEGSGNNKALEIYNPTGCDVDLSHYSLTTYTNGAATTTNFVEALSGTLATGKTVVIYNPSSGTGAGSLTEAATTAGSTYGATVITDGVFPSQVTNFNGNDIVVLMKAGTIIDTFGVIGDLTVKTLTGWPSAAPVTIDHTLRRKAGIKHGNGTVTSPTDGSWDPTAEWDVFPKDTFSGLGQR
ncbi:lamin tail domain-containing protein [Paucibacter sp. R3-3]|uniref:Lamin tail domain-containing protein n=1 Tax=Roseateles agri TaxID=3098619 RepID=A0ABU5DKP2_9BURK|nr:lamin tail domain-containing protein [Paucibacter sp. R3-3]MDY0746852.1 lamin tail domain-containing protein [Paucibacter sp. R3-3]